MPFFSIMAIVIIIIITNIDYNPSIRQHVSLFLSLFLLSAISISNP